MANGANRARVLAIVGLSLLTFAPTLLFPFVWDDLTFVSENRAIRQLQPIGRFFSDKTTLCQLVDYQDKIYRPLRTLGFALVYGAFGADPFFFHLLNLLLHAAVGVLVFALARRLQLSGGGALAAAALFAVHPLHTEAVTWISSLGDLLSTSLFLLTLWLCTGPGKLRRWIALCALFPLALLAKEMSTTLPAVLVLWWLFVPRAAPAPGEGRRHRQLLAMAGVAFVILVGYLAWRYHVLGRAAQMEITAQLVRENLLKLPLTLFEYLRLLCWPHPLIALRAQLAPVSPLSLRFVGPTIAIAALLVLAWRSWRQRTLLGLPILWTLGTLMPVANLLPLGISVAERFAYLPSVGFCWAAGMLFDRCHLRAAASPGALRRRLPLIVAAAVVAAGVALTAARNLVWSDNLRLALDTVSKSNHIVAHWNVASAAIRAEKWQLARKHLHIYLAHGEPTLRALINLSGTYRQLRQPRRAAHYAREAIRRFPRSGSGHLSLGNALLAQRRHARALQAYERAAALMPGSAQVRLNAGIAAYRLGDTRRAERLFRGALQRDRRSFAARVWLVRLYHRRGDRAARDRALSRLRQAYPGRELTLEALIAAPSE